MKYSDMPIGKAMTIAIHICSGGGEDGEEGPMHEGGESSSVEQSENAAPSGPKPKDAPKLPNGWHYMPDGKVMPDSMHEGNEEEYNG